MKIAYPDSFLKLLLIGFSLVALPLLFAFGHAAFTLDQLAEQSRKTISQAAAATRASRVLHEQLTGMERSVRQYLVLEDPALLQRYTTARAAFRAALGELRDLPHDRAQQQRLQTLHDSESRLHSRLVAGPSRELVVQFIPLSELAQDILAASSQLIDRESALLAERAARAQRMLLWQSVILLPVALLVAAALTFLLAQPIRRMDDAIRRLGAERYGEPIAIEGPGDLRRLGERLDWLRTQLQDLEAQKQRFLRHVSHELKTPLTSIREGSELLAEQVGGPLSPQQREIVSILRDNSLRLQRMIENLLDYTAVQFHKPEPVRTMVEIRPLIEHALAAHTLTLETKGIVVTTALANVTAQADQDQLLTVIDNLISNAVKYTPRGGGICITLAERQGLCQLDVQDTGPGVAAADRPHLFEPFYRGSATHDGHVGSSGLGLSIAREYLHAHGGELTLQPSPQGAHFRATLPVSQQVATA